MRKLNAFGRTRAGVTGVPWRDLTDEEFAHYTETVGDLSPYFEDEPAIEPEAEPAPPAPFAPRRTRRMK
jgi:hypothetical protein